MHISIVWRVLFEAYRELWAVVEVAQVEWLKGLFREV